MSAKKEKQHTKEEETGSTEEAKDTGNENQEEQSETVEAQETDGKKRDDKDAEIAQLEERIKQLESENSELKSQYLRKQADFENFRKRMQREKQDAIKYANSDLLYDLISIIDDFERAIKSSEESKDFESFHSGIKLIEKQFVGMLESKYGLTRLESEGEEFDPQKHEAINMEESPEHDVQTVVEDYQRGYMLHDRVLRHSKVKVAVPASDSEQTDAGSHNGSDKGSEQDEKSEEAGEGENGSKSGSAEE